MLNLRIFYGYRPLKFDFYLPHPLIMFSYGYWLDFASSMQPLTLICSLFPQHRTISLFYHFHNFPRIFYHYNNKAG